jgi:phosphohistidine phosphatase SixA
MHELILLRHAQAETAAIGADDYTRELTEEGLRQARAAAQRIAGRHPLPELLLYSPAHRTAATTQIVAPVLGLAPAAVRAVPELYLATPAGLRSAIRAHGSGVERLLIVGHNPGLDELGAQLAEQYRGGHLATGASWRIELAPEAWQRLLRP